MSKNQVRYPGTRPFSRAEQALFFGRDDDAEALAKLILLERTTILYGKSGFGKSSLLYARIVPFFQQNKQTHGVVVRFHAYHVDRPTDLAGMVRQTLVDSTAADLRDTSRLDFTGLLREIARQSGKHRFLFVFDQAEEIFDYPEKSIRQLAQLLNDLVYLPDHESGRGALDVRILLGIRADRMSGLDSLSTYLPDILKHTCELRPLTKAQAIDAIVTPALYARDDFSFACPRFYYDDKALDTILAFLTANGKSPIEAFQLQIICSDLEKKITADPDQFRNAGGQLEVQAKHVADLQNVYENYYLNLLNAVAESADIQILRKTVEEGLIIQERRLTVDGEALQAQYGVQQGQLNALVDAHLLRREQNSSGGYSYEIAHDAFITPILRARQKRETREYLDLEIRQREAEQVRLKEAAKIAGKKRLRALAVAISMSIIAALLAWLSFNLKQEKTAADQLAKDFERQKITADSLRAIAEARYNQLRTAQANEYLRKGEDYLGLPMPEKYLQAALREFEQAYAIDSSAITKSRIDSLRRRLNR